MAIDLVVKDRVAETTASTGTGDVVVSGALPGARGFASLANGAKFTYCLEEGTNWETGEATWTSGTNTISRDLVQSSSTGSRLNLSGSGATISLSATSRYLQALIDEIALKVSTSVFTNYVITNTNNLNDLAFEIAAKTELGHVGLQVSRSSGAQLQIATGAIHANTRTDLLVVASPITLDLTVAGDLVNAATRTTNSWYWLLLGKIGPTVVAGLSTTLAKPSAWDAWQIVGAMRTNATGSGEWDPFMQSGNWFFYDGEMYSFNSASTTTTEQSVRCWCPPISSRVKLYFRGLGPNAYVWARYRNVAAGTVQKLIHTRPTHNTLDEFDMTTNSSGVVYQQFDTAATWDAVATITRGFRCPIGEAGHV
ncbi:hypothetical protein AB1L30_01230 [Bremerella sp. JC817]|uniref:hypothetical protein n=1 Tax=Bremerella sp. JC817 TaxID=3231756 RepID=UPI0034585138